MSGGTTASGPPFEPRGSVAVVTGAAGGIGAALVRGLAARGAEVVVATDLDDAHTRGVARVLDAEFTDTEVVGHGLDAADGAAVAELVDLVERRHGPVDLFCANAGIGTASGADAPAAMWQRTWEVNVMAHVHAANALLPHWQARGRGHLLVTASAAGLLTNLGDAPYSVTKHAAVAFAEWLSVTHGDGGIGVTCLCPQGVRTAMVYGDAADEFSDLRDTEGPSGPSAAVDHDTALAVQVVRGEDVIEPAQAAGAALDALEQGRFLALPHPEVADYERARAADHDRWIRAMRRLQAHLGAAGATGTTRTGPAATGSPATGTAASEPGDTP